MRALLLLVFRRIVAIYFREVEIAGEVPTATTGGRLFAANHVNALVNPILVLTQAPCAISPVAKSTLWKIPGLKWLLDAADAVPIVRRRDDPNKSEKDNDAVFARVASHLGGGGNILIFPEGTSHNEPHLLGLRSGAGLMLAKSHDAGAKNLTFQAVALEFDDREVFRSRSLVLFGPVRSVDAIAGADTTAAITTQIKDDLSELLVEGATWEERVLLIHVAEMFADDAHDASLVEMNRIGRRIEQARRVLAASDPGIVKGIEERVASYYRGLEDAGVGDRFVERFARLGGEVSAAVERDRIASAAVLFLVLPLAVVGSILYWLPYQLPRLVTRKVSHGEGDVSSTYKLGVGLVVFPIWAAIAITIAFLRLPIDQAWIATAVTLTSPFAALAWVDRWDRLAARARLLAPSEERRERMVLLAAERAGLMRDLEAARVTVEGDASAPALQT